MYFTVERVKVCVLCSIVRRNVCVVYTIERLN